MVDYVFELAESKSRERIGELTQARDRQLTDALNKAGTLTFGLPLRDDLSVLVEEVQTCVRIKRRLQSGELRVEWEGPVWTVEEKTKNELSIGCVGWLQTLERRETKPVGPDSIFEWDTLSYADQDAGFIALDLLRQSNADSRYSDGNYVVPGDCEVTQQRTQTYSPWSKVLTEIQNLADLEDGFDLAVDPVTRELNVYAKLSTVRSEVVYEYGKNVIEARRSSDASRICNRFVAYSSIGFAVAEDLDSQADLGLLEESLSLSDVKDVSILQAYANAEVAVRSRPLRLSSFDPRRASSAFPEDPQPFRDFRTGDVVFQTVDCGRLSIVKQAHRIFGMTVDWDSSGQPRVSGLQTTAT